LRQILLIEDSPEYQLIVRAALAGLFDVTCVSNAESALKAIFEQKPDLILLDVGLPGRDGLSLCQELRGNERLENTPILFVTGRKETGDIVSGFAVGADDYIVKPFHPEELKVRIEARMKRHDASSSSGTSAWHDQYLKANLRFAIGRQRVTDTSNKLDRELDLTPNEFKILYFLARNEGRVISRAEVLLEVWGENLHVIERTVDKHICSLRRKMGSAAPCVASVPGQGYQFRAGARISLDDASA
jgi:DNA-binding response OmpR family regulator